MRPQDQLIELLHELTQFGLTVTFEADFTGMLTISYSNGDHAHVGSPGGDMKDLTVAVVRELAGTLEENNE